MTPPLPCGSDPARGSIFQPGRSHPLHPLPQDSPSVPARKRYAGRGGNPSTPPASDSPPRCNPYFVTYLQSPPGHARVPPLYHQPRRPPPPANAAQQCAPRAPRLLVAQSRHTPPDASLLVPDQTTRSCRERSSRDRIPHSRSLSTDRQSRTKAPRLSRILPPNAPQFLPGPLSFPPQPTSRSLLGQPRSSRP